MTLVHQRLVTQAERTRCRLPASGPGGAQFPLNLPVRGRSQRARVNGDPGVDRPSIGSLPQRHRLPLNVRERPSHSRAGMKRTLALLEAVAESGGR